MRLAPALICLLVVLAGCNTGFGPGAQPSPTATPTATPTPTPSTTPGPDPRDVGLAADGVVEPLTLRNAHVEQLANSSYTLTRRVTVRRPNGSVVLSIDRSIRTGPQRDHFLWNETREVAPGAPTWVTDLYRGDTRERAYSNDTVTVVELVEDGRRTVELHPEPNSSNTPFQSARHDFTARDVVFDTFLDVRTRVTAIDREGDTVRYHLADGEGPHDLQFDSPFAIESQVLSLSATVERTGLVRRIVLRYALEHENETVVVREVLRVEDVGSTTVERPPWVDDVVADAREDPRLARPAATDRRRTAPTRHGTWTAATNTPHAAPTLTAPAVRAARPTP